MDRSHSSIRTIAQKSTRADSKERQTIGAGLMGATPSGTRDYFDLQRQGPGQISPVILGRTGWSVSPVGFGAYRTVFEQHEEALRTALLSGFNLIDTSPSYGNGSSEQLIGKVISSLISEGALTREQIILVTKVPLGPQTSINDRLTRSLERLRTDSIDVLLLENPEYFLKNGGTHAEYYQLLRTAFEDLESEVRRGRIQYYGISSNTLPEPKNHDTTKKPKLVRLGRASRHCEGRDACEAS
ncbi:MAG: hypothetical protein A2599_03365 [Candidatus Staskawiczbacteria bacterium RIFOXYD1_FULL_39_28]|nr:MAG: hypothetical protein A2599_03365 [Candidatus Staskawiczbacteria bacterium RIFOXYD1_FULL_39_28]